MTTTLGLLTGVLGTMAFYSLREKYEEQNKIDAITAREFKVTQREQEVIEYEQRVNSFIDAIVDAERNRLGDELHDDLMQRLSGISLRISTMGYMSALSDSDKDELEEIEGDIKSSMYLLRRLLMDLNTVEISEQTLGTGLRELCDRMSKSSKLKITYLHVVPEWEHPIDSATKKEIYRITQEAINNALKHSNGWKVAVTLQWHAFDVTVTVADDGIHDEKSMNRRVGGFGFSNMMKRAKRIKGTLEADQLPSGTSVTLRISYENLGWRGSAIENRGELINLGGR